jgi:P-type Mg2+ transporter
LTQTLIIHIIRTAKIPFFESLASPALIITSAVICMVGIAPPFTYVGASLGFVRWHRSIGRLCSRSSAAMRYSPT